MTFVQDGAPAHTTKADQTWCEKNLPNFYTPGHDLPANSPDLNIIDETTYKDPAHETLDELRRRLWFGGKKINSRYASGTRALFCTAT